MEEQDPILLQILKEDPDIEDAEARYQQFLADDALREKYQDREKFLRDQRSIMASTRREGLEQGLKEGREQGLEQGLEQGQINLLVRQLNRRFGLRKDEEQAIRSCRDMERIETAADAFADPDATKQSILRLLTGNGSA